MIEKGKNHLIYESSTNFTFELFAEFDKHGTPSICVTTQLPKKLKKEFNLKTTEFIWIEDPEHPAQLSGDLMKELKVFIDINPGCVIMIDELEYLILENGYETVESFLVELGELAAEKECTMIVPLNPSSITEEISTALSRKFDDVKDARSFVLTGNKVECPECGAMWHTSVPTCDICGYEFGAERVKPSLASEEKTIPRKEAKISGKIRTKAPESKPERLPVVEDEPVRVVQQSFEEKKAPIAYDHQIRPEDDSWFNRGVALEKMGKSEQAIECFDKALEENPNDSWAWFNKGVSLHRLGLLGEALYCYDKALSFNPNDADLMSNKGILLRTLGKTDEALECYKKALDISPHDPGIWSNLGVTYRVLGEMDKALEAYDKALSIDRLDVGVWLNKAAALQSEGRFDEAIACYEEVLRINPYHPVALRNKEFAMARSLRS